MAVYDPTDGTNSRIESSLTGAEGKFSAPVSRLEQIILGEDIKPLSRIEEVMKEYVDTHGGSGSDLTTINCMPRGLDPRNNEEEYGDVVRAKVYDPYEWVPRAARDTNMRSDIDTDGYYHIHAVNNANSEVRANGVYHMIIDPSIIKRINYSVKLGENSFYKLTEGNTYQINFALLDKFVYTNSDWFPNESYCVAYNFHEKYYTDDQDVKHFKERITGSFDLSDIHQPVYFAYGNYGCDMTFDTIEFILKEE